MSRGFHRVCPWDKSGENLGQTRVFSLFYTVEARFHRACPWDKPGLSQGQSRGRRAAQKVYVKKSLCAFFARYLSRLTATAYAIPPHKNKNPNQGGKRNPNPNFLVRIFSSGVGVFHVNGWGPKSSIRPSKPGKSNFLGGISRDFAGISRGHPKSLRKKKFGFNFRSLTKDFCDDIAASIARYEKCIA